MKPISTKMMTKHTGFTLIEFVIVIVLLAILSVTAYSKFLNLQSDARISALRGLKGGMQSASDMLHPLAVQQGLDTVSQATIVIEGDNISLVYGYPAADSANAWSLLIESTFADAVFNSDDPANWYFHNTGPTNPWIRFRTASKNSLSDQCFLTYHEATPTTQPRFEFILDDC